MFVAADVHYLPSGGARAAAVVAAAGMPRAQAASLVQRMAGRHRLPDALRRADTLARHGTPQAPHC